MQIKIAQRYIGNQHTPFVIAEMSGNHNQSLDRAMAIVDAAAEAGAHAIKLQTYTADTMTLRGVHTIDDPNSLWYKYELHDLYKQAYTPWEWHAAIFERARQQGMVAFSSPFDESSVDFLESLDVPLYKVASFENTDHPLLKKIAQTGKPVIMSTGVASAADITESVAVLRQHGCTQLVLLKCTSTYPATPQNTNLRTLPHLAQLHHCLVGLSDHTMGIGAAVAAVALGACVIEKHFTLRRADGGVDATFSLEPAELAALVTETARAAQALGHIQYDVQTDELPSLAYKRSIYVAQDVAAGDVFTTQNLRRIRPANGLPPKYYDLIVGKKASRSIAAGTPLSWDLVLGA